MGNACSSNKARPHGSRTSKLTSNAELIAASKDSKPHLEYVPTTTAAHAPVTGNVNSNPDIRINPLGDIPTNQSKRTHMTPVNRLVSSPGGAFFSESVFVQNKTHSPAIHYSSPSVGLNNQVFPETVTNNNIIANPLAPVYTVEKHAPVYTEEVYVINNPNSGADNFFDGSRFEKNYTYANNNYVDYTVRDPEYVYNRYPEESHALLVENRVY